MNYRQVLDRVREYVGTTVGAPLITLIGPTASGKTELSLRLARDLPLEIISADARQVYRGMDIATGKVSQEVRDQVSHHLIDIRNPDEAYTVKDFMGEARACIDEIIKRDHIPCIVGGTGLYVSALLEGYQLHDEDEDARILQQDLEDRYKAEGMGVLHHELERRGIVRESISSQDYANYRRVIRHIVRSHSGMDREQHRRSGSTSLSALTIGINYDTDTLRQELYDKINNRHRDMYRDGLLDEVRLLMASGYGQHVSSMQTIGYREACRYSLGEMSLEDAVTETQKRARNYAKRQLTWWRKRTYITWVDPITYK